MDKYEPSIEYLELYAVTVAIMKWLKLFNNKRICLHCDNQSAVHMINNNSSSCKNCMVLLRLIVLEAMVQNVRITALHVGTKENGKADSLSRLDLARFWRISGYTMNRSPSEIPEDIWPISKIWWYY